MTAQIVTEIANGGEVYEFDPANNLLNTIAAGDGSGGLAVAP